MSSNEKISLASSSQLNHKLQKNKEPLMNLTNSSMLNRSQISTSRGKSTRRTSSIDKTKIKILPNYEKYMMGNNLPFITIFQTIQIERLSQEVESQRVRLKQYERQIFNSESFEIQIKELNEKCLGYEEEIGEYREELDKMNKICETIYHENQNLKAKLKNNDSSYHTKLDDQIKKTQELKSELNRWKNKHQNSEKQKQREFQNMKQMIEKQRKSMLNREIKDIQVRHQSQIANLSIEIRKLNQFLSRKQQECDDIKEENENNKAEIAKLNDNLQKISQYEEKISLLTQEHLRLSHIIDQNQNQLHSARNKQLKFNQQLQCDREVLADNQHLQEALNHKQEDLKQLQGRNKELEAQLIKKQELQLFNQELQEKIMMAMTDNQKFAKILKERSHEIEKWKRMSLEQENQLQKCRELEDNLIQMESKFNSLKLQNERLKNTLRAKNDQLGEITEKSSVFRDQHGKLCKLQKQIKNLEEKYHVQVERNQQLNSYLQKFQRQSQGSKNLSHKMIESEKMKDYYLRENEKLKNKVQELTRKIEGLKKCQKQFMRQSQKVEESNYQIIEHESKINLLSEEVKRLNVLLKSKNDEIIRLEDEKIDNYSTITQNKNLEDQLSEKQLNLNKLRKEIDGYYEKVKQLEDKIDQLERKNEKLMENNRNSEIKISTLQLKAQQYDELKQKYSKLQLQLSQINQIQKICQKQQNRITLYLKDIEQLKSYNQTIEYQLQEKNITIRQLTEQIKKKDYDRVIEEEEPSQQKVTLQKLMFTIKELETTVTELDQRYRRLLKKVEEESRNDGSYDGKSSRVSLSHDSVRSEK